MIESHNRCNGIAPCSITVALGTILAVVGLNLGCESQAPPPISTPAAETEFQWVIKRLEHALEAFSPSSSIGLRVKREMTYELIPPSSSQANYTARITITSKTAYKSEFKYLDKQKDQAEEKVDPLVYDAILAEDSATDPFNDPGQLIADLPMKKQITMQAPMPVLQINDQEVFELAHRDGRWQLLTQPESQRARNWFNYALDK